MRWVESTALRDKWLSSFSPYKMHECCSGTSGAYRQPDFNNQLAICLSQLPCLWDQGVRSDSCFCSPELTCMSFSPRSIRQTWNVPVHQTPEEFRWFLNAAVPRPLELRWVSYKIACTLKAKSWLQRSIARLCTPCSFCIESRAPPSTVCTSKWAQPSPPSLPCLPSPPPLPWKSLPLLCSPNPHSIPA